MKILGIFTDKEVAAYQKASALLTDKERQIEYTKIWNLIKKRTKLPANHNFIITDDWSILDKGQRKEKNK